MNRPVFETTATALREKSKLRRHFRRFDMFFYLICTVVTIDTIGAQGFTWLIFLGVFALGVAEISSWEAEFGRSRRTAPSSCGRASRTGGTTRRPT